MKEKKSTEEETTPSQSELNDVLYAFANRLQQESKTLEDESRRIQDKAPGTADGIYIVSGALDEVGKILKDILAESI